MSKQEIRYQLRIVYINPVTKLPIPEYMGQVMCTIGTFKDEEELAKWATENKGEIEKC